MKLYFVPKSLSKEAITVDRGGPYEGELQANEDTRANTVEIRFQTDEEYYNFRIAPLAYIQAGRLNYGTNYIAIFYDGPIDEIAGLYIQRLNFNYKRANWVQGKNPLVEMLEQATGKKYRDPSSGTYEEEGGEPLPRGITVHQSQVVDVFGPYPGEFQTYMRFIVPHMIKEAAHLMEEGRIEFYEVDSQNQNIAKTQVVESPEYTEKMSNLENQEKLQIARYKSAIDSLLSNFPALREFQRRLVDEHYPDIEPTSAQVDIRNSTPIKGLLDDNFLATEIHQAMMKIDDETLKTLNTIYTRLPEIGTKYDMGSLLYHFREDNYPDLIRTTKNGTHYYLRPEWIRPEVKAALKGTPYETEYAQYEKAIIDSIPTTLRQVPFRLVQDVILPLRGRLDFSDSDLALLEQAEAAAEEEKRQEAEAYTRAEEERKKSAIEHSLLADWGEAYVDINEGLVHELPYNHTLGDFVSQNKDSFEWYGEGIWWDAREKAEEELTEELPERPSQIYGQDKAEVQQDLLWEADDFLEDNEYFEKETDENILKKAEELNGNEYCQFCAAIVTNRGWLDDFIQWKIDKMVEAEEGEDAWKYELDEDEVSRKAWEFEAEIAQAEAYNHGIVYLSYDDYRGQLFVVNGGIKYKEAILSFMHKLIDKNVAEGYFDKRKKTPTIDINFYDQQGREVEGVDGWTLFGSTVGAASGSNWFRKARETVMIKTAKVAEQELERLLLNYLPSTEFAGKVYGVGGYVRDKIMGIQSKDLDIVIEQKGGAEALAKAIHGTFPDETSDAYQMGASYPIWHIVFKKDVGPFQCAGAELDIADTQKETFPDHNSRQRVTEFGTLQEDIARRDFTINMLLSDMTTGKVVDPTGTGISDIKNKVLRAHPNVDPARMFDSDPLRLMRMVRFQAKYGLDVDSELLEAAKDVAPRIDIISMERVMNELTKLMTIGKFAEGLKALDEIGVLQRIMPEIKALQGVEHDKVRGVHLEGDVWNHTMEVIKNAPYTIEGQMAALLHDVGKPATQEFIEDKIMFKGHADVSEEIAKAVLQRLRFPEETVRRVCKMVKYHMRALQLQEAKKGKVKNFIREVGEDIVESLFDLTEADERGTHPPRDTVPAFREQVRQIMQEEPPQASILDGREIMEILGIKGGPVVGEVKTFLEQVQDERPITKEEAIQLIRERFGR